MLRGMVAWEPDQRRSLNPSVGVRRQLPLHKGAVFAAQRTTIPFCGAGPGLQSSPYRVMVYHTRSTEAEQCIKPSASFGSSVTLVQCLDGRSSLCRIAHNHPFLWRWARIAKQPLPGDGLSHPEHRGRAVHKAFSEFWVQRHAGPVPGRPFLSLPD